MLFHCLMFLVVLLAPESIVGEVDKNLSRNFELQC